MVGVGGLMYYGYRMEDTKIADEKKSGEIASDAISPDPTITLPSAKKTTFNVNDYKFNQTYTDKKGRFSFTYPEGFTVNVIKEDDNIDILTLNKSSTDIGLQVRIIDAKEAVAITEDKIVADVPDMLVNEGVAVAINSKGKGLMFVSDSEDFGGNSREVWFSKGNFVYQLSAKMEYDDLAKTILNSWKF